MEESATWLKEMALLDTETLSVPYLTAWDESPYNANARAAAVTSAAAGPK
jgi:hypothetical protein